MPIAMKVSAAVLCVVILLALTAESHAFRNPFMRTYTYGRDFARGSRDMIKAYTDMREANWRNSDKYFHARGNYDAAKHGTGGRHAAAVISNLREWSQGGFLPSRRADSQADQEANRWGRNGGDPNKYRPKGLPPKY